MDSAEDGSRQHLASRGSFDADGLPDPGPSDVAVFWDYENVRIPEWCPAAKASDCIRRALMPFGRIVERKLYYDSNKPAERNSMVARSDLDLSGFTLVDCPTRNNKKETVDKKLIVDSLFFAWERASRGAKACVALITSDGDYSYTLARLQDIGVYTIVIFKPDIVASILIDVANTVYTWENEVLGGAGLPPSAPEPDKPEEQTGNARNPYFSQSSRVAILKVFLRCLLECEPSRFPSAADGESWKNDALLAAELYKRTIKDKALYHSAKTDAIKKKLVECGRRNMDDPQTPIARVDFADRYHGNWSLETYLRLTPEGVTRVEDEGISARMDQERGSFEATTGSGFVDSFGKLATKNLHVAGFGPRTTEQDLFREFSKFARIKSVSVKTGFAFVNTSMKLDAVHALTRLDGTVMNGGKMKINFAKEL